MTRNLLDTNVVLLAQLDPGRLSGEIKDTISHGQNLVSVVTYWEVMIKSMKGKLDVGDPKGWWALSIQKLVATSLSLTPRHVEFFQGLPSIHSDPFDRILVAQAMAENLTLVTLDTGIASYATKKLRVVC